VTQNLAAACQGTLLPARGPSEAKPAFLAVVASSCPSLEWECESGCQHFSTKEPISPPLLEKHLMAHLQQVEGRTKTGVTELIDVKEINETEFGQMAGKWWWWTVRMRGD